MLHNSPNDHNILQFTLKQIAIPPSTTQNDVATLTHKPNQTNLDINFHQHELLSLELQKQHDSFMIIAQFHHTCIKRTLIDNGSSLNVCSVSLLDQLEIDRSQIILYFISIQGFDNTKKQPLSVITLLIVVGLVTLQTPIHVLLDDLL